ncbi:arylesterase [Tsuneonella amylolytica]|uniref:arylesterase n=1 Tax=Tsuneonella amylolytica TaxID=2338327 RepID=UPI000EA9A12E|nr:arylesterase [Tsuneonella amylolytica]
MRMGRLPMVVATLMAGGLVSGCKQDAPAEPVTTISTEPSAPVAKPSASETAGEELTVLAFGDSLFAGYGLSDPGRLSYPAKLEAALDAKGRNVRMVNAGVSGDTTAAGRQRLAFTLDSQKTKPDLAILELGGNDLLRGLPPEQTRANLAAMLDTFRQRGIPVVLFGLEAPPNYGPKWQEQFDAVYGSLAREYDVPLVPFVTEAVFARPILLQADRVHPTAEGVDQLVSLTADRIAAALPDRD